MKGGGFRVSNKERGRNRKRRGFEPSTHGVIGRNGKRRGISPPGRRLDAVDPKSTDVDEASMVAMEDSGHSSQSFDRIVGYVLVIVFSVLSLTKTMVILRRLDLRSSNAFTTTEFFFRPSRTSSSTLRHDWTNLEPISLLDVKQEKVITTGNEMNQG